VIERKRVIKLASRKLFAYLLILLLSQERGREGILLLKRPLYLTWRHCNRG
jgi:hypothetical protein